MGQSKQSDAKKRRLEALSHSFKPSKGSPAGGRPGKKTKVTSPLEPQPEAPAFPYVALQRQTLPDHLRPFAQTSSGSATLSAAEQLLQAAAVTKKADAIVRVNDLREKGYHLHSQGPKQAHTRTSGQAAVEAKLLSGRKLKKLGVSKLDQHLRYEDLVPIAAAWQEYASSFVHQQGNPASKLTFNGCQGCICRSRNPMLQHLRGIIAKDTRTTWHVMAENDHLFVCPKAVCDWQFSIVGSEMILTGAAMMR